MNEFRKEYEYEEEKGVSGFLLIFFLMTVSFEVVLGVTNISAGYQLFESLSVPGSVFSYIGAAYIALAFLAGLSLFKIRRFAMAIVRVFLVARIIYLLPVDIVFFVRDFTALQANKASVLYQKNLNTLVFGITLDIIYVLSFSILWYLYLRKSEKVESLYPREKAGKGDGRSI